MCPKIAAGKFEFQILLSFCHLFRFRAYKFTCDCVACTKDYPTMLNLRQTKAPGKLTMSSNDHYQLSDQKRALQKFKECGEYLEKNDPSYPSMALFQVRMGMLGAFSTLCRNYTLSVSTK
jgi:hypothetical protein